MAESLQKREKETIAKELNQIQNNIKFSISPKIREKKILIQQVKDAMAR